MDRFTFCFGLNLGVNKACACLQQIPLLLIKHGWSGGIDLTADNVAYLKKVIVQSPHILIHAAQNSWRARRT